MACNPLVLLLIFLQVLPVSSSGCGVHAIAACSHQRTQLFSRRASWTHHPARVDVEDNMLSALINSPGASVQATASERLCSSNPPNVALLDFSFVALLSHISQGSTILSSASQAKSTTPLKQRLHMLLTILKRLLEVILFLLEILNLLHNRFGILRLRCLHVRRACVDEPGNGSQQKAAMRESAPRTGPERREEGNDLHLSNTIVDGRLFGQSVDFGRGQLEHALLARLRGQLLPHQHELLLREGGFGVDFLQELL